MKDTHLWRQFVVLLRFLLGRAAGCNMVVAVEVEVVVVVV